MKKVQVKRIHKDFELEDFELPQYGTAEAAGLDLRAYIEHPILVEPGQTVMVGTGLAFDINDPSVACVLLPRSGLGAKNGIVLGNLVGLCDSDYHGEYTIAVWNRNTSGEAFIIKPLDRIAQAVFVPVIQVELEEVSDFDRSTQRGTGGFGSTGKN